MARNDNPSNSPKAINTFEFSNYTPQRDGALSTVGFALSKALTEALYNLDQLFLTPIRIVTWLAAAGIGAALIGPWGWFVLVPAIVLVLSSLLRAIYASPKAKDVVSILIKHADSNFELTDATIEGETTTVTIIKAVALFDNSANQHFFLSLHKKNGRLYTTKIAISKDEADEYNAPQADDRGQRERLYRQFLSRVCSQKTIPPNTFFGWFFKEWIEFSAKQKTPEWKKLSFGAALLERIEFFKKNIAEPIFSFLFDAAFFYWVIWSAAFLFGALNTSLVVALPFATPLMLIAPLGGAVLLFLVKNWLSYRSRNEPANSSAAKHTVELLVKVAQAKEAVAQVVARTSFDTTKLASIREEDLAKLTSVADSERSFYQKFKDFFVGNFSIQAITDVSPSGYRTRIAAHALIRFTTGLIMGFIALWPIFDLVATQWLGAGVVGVAALGAGSLVGPAMFAYLCVAVVIGLSFAVYSFTKVPAENRFQNQEANRYAQLKKFRTAGTPENALYLELRQLERLIALKKSELANERLSMEKKLLDEVWEKDFGAYLYSYIEFPIGIMGHFINLIRGKDNSDKTRASPIEECIVAHDDKEFMEKFNLWKKSRILANWDKCKMFFNRFNEVVTAGGSGMLLVRIVFFGSMACSIAFLGTSGAAFVATPLVAGLSLGLMGTAWAIFRLCLYLYRRDQNFADMLIHQTSAYKSLLENTYTIACAELLKLRNAAANTLTAASAVGALSVEPPAASTGLGAYSAAPTSPTAASRRPTGVMFSPMAPTGNGMTASPQGNSGIAASASVASPIGSVAATGPGMWPPPHKEAGTTGSGEVAEPSVVMASS